METCIFLILRVTFTSTAMIRINRSNLNFQHSFTLHVMTREQNSLSRQNKQTKVCLLVELANKQTGKTVKHIQYNHLIRI